MNGQKVIKSWMIIAGIAILILLLSSLFTVDQRQQVLVTRLGEPVRVIKEPGLKFKVPFIESRFYFDNRVLDLDADPIEPTTLDQKRIIIDAFAKYRIVDPLKFYQTVRDESGIRQNLSPTLDSSIRSVLGSVPMSALLSNERIDIMESIQEMLAAQAQRFGVEVIDVRIMRADLPPANSEAIFRRMQTEREREAKEFRSLGEEEGVRIRSRASRERVGIIAEAQKQAQIIRGEGDGEASRIFAEAFNRDSEFFAFWRAMQAYRASLGKEGTRYVLSPESEFLRFMHSQHGR